MILFALWDNEGSVPIDHQSLFVEHLSISAFREEHDWNTLLLYSASKPMFSPDFEHDLI